MVAMVEPPYVVSKSTLQREIIAVLFEARYQLSDGHSGSGKKRLGELLTSLDKEPTPSNRASVSRSVRNLVDCKILYEIAPLNGKGNFFAITERVWRDFHLANSVTFRSEW